MAYDDDDRDYSFDDMKYGDFLRSAEPVLNENGVTIEYSRETQSGELAGPPIELVGLNGQLKGQFSFEPDKNRRGFPEDWVIHYQAQDGEWKDYQYSTLVADDSINIFCRAEGDEKEMSFGDHTSGFASTINLHDISDQVNRHLMTSQEAMILLLALHRVEAELIRSDGSDYGMFNTDSHITNALEFLSTAMQWKAYVARDRSDEKAASVQENNDLTIKLRQHMKTKFLETLEQQKNIFHDNDIQPRVLGSTLLQLLIEDQTLMPIMGTPWPHYISQDLDISAYIDGPFDQAKAERADKDMTQAIKKVAGDVGFKEEKRSKFGNIKDGQYFYYHDFTREEIVDIFADSRAGGERVAERYEAMGYPVRVYLEVQRVPSYALPSWKDTKPVRIGKKEEPVTQILRNNADNYLASILVRAMQGDSTYARKDKGFNPADLLHIGMLTHRDMHIYKFGYDSDSLTSERHAEQAEQVERVSMVRLISLLKIATQGLEPKDLSFDHLQYQQGDTSRQNDFRAALGQYESLSPSLCYWDMPKIFLQTETILRQVFPGNEADADTTGLKQYGPLWLKPEELQFIEKVNGFKLSEGTGNVLQTSAERSIDVSLLKKESVFGALFEKHPHLERRITDCFELNRQAKRGNGGGMSRGGDQPTTTWVRGQGMGE